MAQQSSVPESVWAVFEDAISEAESGITGWLNYVNSYRLVRLITYPARLPMSVARGFLSRLTGLLPTLGEGSMCRAAVESLIEQLYSYITQGGYWLQPKNHTARYA